MLSSAWESIVHMHCGSVVSAALRVLGCSADAEDVAQEVFVEAFRKWNPYDDNNWRGLLCRMAVCRALDLLRTRRAEPGLNFSADVGQAIDPSEMLIQQEVMQQLRKAVTQLPQREAEVFCLVCFEQLDHEEVAATLKISRGAVATALSKARTKLGTAFHVISGDVK